jgi:lipoprotein-anchoring transpeptidase ErfK/SrfK
MQNRFALLHPRGGLRFIRSFVFCLMIGLVFLLGAVQFAAPVFAAEPQNGILAPAEGATVAGTVNVEGVAVHPTFRKWQLDLLVNGDPAHAAFLAVAENQLPNASNLISWDTSLYPNGNHVLRLRVVHSNLNYDEYYTPVVVRNASPTGTSSASFDEAENNETSTAETAIASEESTTSEQQASADTQEPAVIKSATFRDDVPLRGERRIVVDISDQTLTAYQGEEVVFRTSVSTGKPGWRTLPGTFKVQRKYDQTRMTGPDYDTPDVPWTMYYDGAFAIHGAYWHNNFGTPVSHGCVNLRVEEAKALYQWASEGDTVIVNR